MMADSKRICCVSGCDNPFYARGVCRRHYDAQRPPRHGKKSNAPRPRREPCFSFIEGLADAPADRCIEWPYAILKNGYGSVRYNGVAMTAHRASLMYWVGPPPTRQHQAAHLPVICHNRACVNPKHLAWKTGSENNMDKWLDGTMQTSNR